MIKSLTKETMGLDKWKANWLNFDLILTIFVLFVLFLKKLLSVFSNLLRYNKKIYFQNIEKPNHYEKSPYSFSPKFGIKYHSKRNTELKNGLKELIYVIKKENRLW